MKSPEVPTRLPAKLKTTNTNYDNRQILQDLKFGMTSYGVDARPGLL